MEKLAEAQKQLSRKRVYTFGKSVSRTAHHLPVVWVTEEQDDMQLTYKLPAGMDIMGSRIYKIPDDLRIKSPPTWGGMPDRVKQRIFGFLNTLEKSRVRQVTDNDKRVMDLIPQSCGVVKIQVSQPWMTCKVFENSTTPMYEIDPEHLTFDMSSIFKNPGLVIRELRVSVFLSGFGRLKKLIYSFQFWGLPKNSLNVEHLRLDSEIPAAAVLRSHLPDSEEDSPDTFKYFVELLTYLNVRVLKKISINSLMAIDLLQRLADTPQWKHCSRIGIRTKNLFHYNQLFDEWRGTNIVIWGLEEKSLNTPEADSFVKPFLEKQLGSTYEVWIDNAEEAKPESFNHLIPTVLGGNLLHVTLDQGHLKGVVVEQPACSCQEGASSSNY